MTPESTTSSAMFTSVTISLRCFRSTAGLFDLCMCRCQVSHENSQSLHVSIDEVGASHSIEVGVANTHGHRSRLVGGTVAHS